MCLKNGSSWSGQFGTGSGRLKMFEGSVLPESSWYDWYNDSVKYIEWHISSLDRPWLQTLPNLKCHVAYAFGKGLVRNHQFRINHFVQGSVGLSWSPLKGFIKIDLTPNFLQTRLSTWRPYGLPSPSLCWCGLLRQACAVDAGVVP